MSKTKTIQKCIVCNNAPIWRFDGIPTCESIMCQMMYNEKKGYPLGNLETCSICGKRHKSLKRSGKNQESLHRRNQRQKDYIRNKNKDIQK